MNGSGASEPTGTDSQRDTSRMIFCEFTRRNQVAYEIGASNMMISRIEMELNDDYASRRAFRV